MLAVGLHEDQAVEQSEHTLVSILADGTPVMVRPVQQSDLVLIQEMHQRLSKDSIYSRYLAPRTPDLQELQRLCFLDGQPGVALVATVQAPQEQVVAMACYMVHPDDPTTAEPAVLVEDSYQGRGVGKQMLLALCQHAEHMGLETFACFTLLANHRVMRLIKGCGLRYQSRYSEGVNEIRVRLKSE
jgi:RimJ/RimL family protein N-acetyltransferase